MNNPTQYFYMNAAELMDYAFHIYKKSFLNQFVMAVIGSILAMVFSAALLVILVAGWLSAILPALSGNGGYFDTPFSSIQSIAPILAVAFSLFILLTSFAPPLMLLGNFFITKQAFYNETPDIGTAFPAAARSFFRFVTVALAESILIVPVIFAGAYLLGTTLSGVPYLLYGDVTAGLVASLIAITAVFALILIVINTFFCLSVPVALFEKKYFFSALNRSFKLVKQDFWRILAVNLTWQIVIKIAYYSTVGVLDLFFLLSTFVGDTASMELGRFITGTTAFRYIFLACVNLFLLPLGGCIFNCLIYFNQRIKLEGLDIEIGVEKLSRELRVVRNEF